MNLVVCVHACRDRIGEVVLEICLRLNADDTVDRTPWGTNNRSYYSTNSWRNRRQCNGDEVDEEARTSLPDFAWNPRSASHRLSPLWPRRRNTKESGDRLIHLCL